MLFSMSWIHFRCPFWGPGSISWPKWKISILAQKCHKNPTSTQKCLVTSATGLRPKPEGGRRTLSWLPMRPRTSADDFLTKIGKSIFWYFLTSGPVFRKLIQELTRGLRSYTHDVFYVLCSILEPIFDLEWVSESILENIIFLAGFTLTSGSIANIAPSPGHRLLSK